MIIPPFSSVIFSVLLYTRKHVLEQLFCYQYTARTYVCQYANRTYFLNICLLFFLLYDMIILIVRIIIQIDIDTDLGGLL